MAPTPSELAPAPAAKPAADPPAGSHLLDVVSVRPIADDAVAVVLARTTPPLVHRPGQYVTVTVELDGRRHTRNYSLASTPVDEQLEIGVRREPGGLVSAHLTRGLRPGDRLEVSGPHGRFTLDDPVPERLVLVAGGSGIVPLLALARAALDVSPTTRVGLVYGNRTPGQVMYAEELGALARRYDDRLSVAQFVEQGATAPAVAGRLDPVNSRQVLGALLGGPETGPTACAYLCGPPSLVAVATAALTDLGLPPAQIRTESFSPPPAPRAAANRSHTATVHTAAAASGASSLVHFPVEAGSTLLQAATAAGLTWPASCLVGDCGECHVHLRSGRVELTSVEGLTEEQEAAGHILPCVAYPRTDITITR